MAPRFEPNPAFKREYADEVGPEWQARVGHAAHANMVAGAPRDTGQLIQTSYVEPYTDERGNPAFRVVFPEKHAFPTDQGSGLYGPKKAWITPKVAKVMTWIDRDSGQRVFATRTRGQPGKRYIYRGLVAVFGADRVDEHRFGRR